MEDKNTIDSILKEFTEMAEKKGVIDPNIYLLGCEKINALLQNEQDNLFLLQQTVARMRKKLLEEGKTGTFTKMVIEASDEYLEVQKQKAKIDRAIETIRLGKTHANLSKEVYRNN